MLRTVLIGVGVVTSVLTGYYAKRKLFPGRTETLPAVTPPYHPGYRTTAKRTRSHVNQHLDNERPDLDPMS